MLRAAVTVCVLSVVMTLPKLSSSLTTGWVAKATPAVAVLDGCWVMTNWLAAAGLIVKLLLAPVPVSEPSVADSVELTIDFGSS